MSRIQHILERAERDGYARRMRGPEPLASSGSDLAGVVLHHSTDEFSGEADHSGLAIQDLTPARVVVGAHLDPSLITAHSGNVEAAEQYRSLRTRVMQADTSMPISVMLVTSPGQGEGKTLTASNLALAMAQESRRRVCLIDADLRKPTLQQLFGLPDGPGLCDVLAGTASLSSALVGLEEHQLTILPAGHVPSHPAELLGTAAMRRMLDRLRTGFDRIIVDAPPALPLADVGILTPLIDVVLLVVRARFTSKPAIRDAVASLDRSKLLGLVLNESA